MIEETNKAMENNLSKLRASIEAQRIARSNVIAEEEKSEINIYTPKRLKLIDIPEIIQPDNTEFSLERHIELCNRVDVLYHNYLFYKENMYKEGKFIEISNDNFDKFEQSLKDLAEGFDELINEGCKIRFS